MTDIVAVPGRYTAFSNNKKMVTTLHWELERKVGNVGGHAAEDQK